MSGQIRFRGAKIPSPTLGFYNTVRWIVRAA